MTTPRPGAKAEAALPALLDCRSMSSFSYRAHADPMTGSAAGHEGRKPNVGDYLVLSGSQGRPALYRATKVNHCYNVDPANMWMARVEFVRPSQAAELGLPDVDTWIEQQETSR